MKIPMSSDTKLTKDEECELVDSIKYQGMRGSLLYLTTSRPDIMFSVCLYARFQEDPETSHLEAVKLIKEYFAKISLKACFLELKRKNMKNTVLTSICRIHQGRNGVYVLALHKKPRRTKELYVISKTRSLDYLNSPKFNIIPDLEDQFELEEADSIGEPTMKEYMTKTQDGYGERFKELLMRCPQHYLMDMQEAILFYKGLEVTTRQILDSKGAIPTMIATDAKTQLNAVSDLQDSKLISVPSQMTILFPSYLYDYHYDKENGLYGLKDLDAYSIGTTLCNDALPQKEKDLGSFTLPCFINNVCFEKALADLGASVSVMPFLTYTKLGLGELAHTELIVELFNRTVKHPKGIAKKILVGIGKFVFPVDFIILDMPKDVKVPLILERPFLSTTHAKIDVFKIKITLRVGDEKIIFKSVKPAGSLIKRVYMLSLRERMELDLEARLMGETLILNRSTGPTRSNRVLVGIIPKKDPGNISS
ncbi:hypothetical protein Tco_0019117 [Tanacetum coccineum]